MELIKTNLTQKVLKSFIVIFLGTLALTISAKLKIPFYPVPMTMQTFVVVFLGIAFGYKIGLATVSIYLLEGIIGLPVFSNSPEKGIGLIYFTGPTMGYLIGFLSSVFLIGYLRLNDWTKKSDESVKFFFINFIKLLISVSTIYLFGLFWLSYLIGLDKAILFGLKPFWIAELFKISILAFLIPFILKFRKFI
jgi:biotin transport system substrate-specific component